MKIETTDGVMSVTDLTELTAVNAADFRAQIQAATSAREPREVRIDLSKARYIDSSGIGALFAVYRSYRDTSKLMLLHPIPELRQLLELTQTAELFEIQPE